MSKQRPSKAERQAAIAALRAEGWTPAGPETEAKIASPHPVFDAYQERIERQGDADAPDLGAIEPPTEDEITEAVAETHDLALAPRSVVKSAYKRSYAAKALIEGRLTKADKRGNGDWLQRELQGETIKDDGAFDFERFVAILDANGVDHSRWSRSTKGWEGRFRMSGGMVLRGRVGKSGVFRTPDSEVNLNALAEQGDRAAAAFLSKWAN